LKLVWVGEKMVKGKSLANVKNEHRKKTYREKMVRVKFVPQLKI
jgi:hypothetical protein